LTFLTSSEVGTIELKVELKEFAETGAAPVGRVITVKTS
jgi:hypothetical protein